MFNPWPQPLLIYRETGKPYEFPPLGGGQSPPNRLLVGSSAPSGGLPPAGRDPTIGNRARFNRRRGDPACSWIERASCGSQCRCAGPENPAPRIPRSWPRGASGWGHSATPVGLGLFVPVLRMFHQGSCRPGGRRQGYRRWSPRGWLGSRVARDAFLVQSRPWRQNL